jgi:hypothetical protein
LAKWLVRYINCIVCPCKKTCPHAPADPFDLGKATHQDDRSCAERLEEWLGAECKEKARGS